MTIGNGVFARRLRLRSVRLTDHTTEISRTLVCLIEPRPMRNINYLMTEQLGSVERFSVDIYLPYGRGTLRPLPSERRREGALGSDFAYDDLRTWLYEQEHQYVLIEERGKRAVIQGRCISDSLGRHVRTGTAPFALSVDTDGWFVERIDFLSADGTETVRTFVVHSTDRIGDVTVPTSMEMIDIRRGHSTRIGLNRAEIDIGIDATIFDASRRKHVSEVLCSL